MPTRPLRIGIDPVLGPWDAEIKYAFRCLMRVAGFPYEFVWAGREAGHPLDLYYGWDHDRVASVRIPACGMNFLTPELAEPIGFEEIEDVGYLVFSKQHQGGYELTGDALRFTNDILFASFWLLIGAEEGKAGRDRVDNLDMGETFFHETGLYSKPLVSMYGNLIRQHFRALGLLPLPLPWLTPQARAAFVFTHDVDYPQIIRSVEALRLLLRRGRGGLGAIWGVLQDRDHFWRFADWVDFAKEVGARPAFYFMARKGSLLEYAAGTPDGFYDIQRPEFAELFQQLGAADCEVGLHASFNSHRSLSQLKLERRLLEQASGQTVDGNRHHYWHLDPAAPHETLRLNEQAGFLYDSSLAFEYYPGFRRGICHPFRVFHPGERREIDLVELPPAWMDDHFDRRLAQNGITDPVQYAYRLIEAAKSTGGTIVVDYHVRGMNRSFYPGYGPWLKKLVEARLDCGLGFSHPRGPGFCHRVLLSKSAFQALPGIRATTRSTLKGFGRTRGGSPDRRSSPPRLP